MKFKIVGLSLWDIPVLAQGKVRFAGEKVAAVAAEDLEAAAKKVGWNKPEAGRDVAPGL